MSEQALDMMRTEAYQQLREGFFEKSIDSFSACLSLAPEDAGSLQGRAIARFQIKDWAGAESDFSRAKSLAMDDAENWIGYGMTLAMQLKIYPAIAELEAAIAKWPDLVRAYIQLGLLHLKIGAITKGKDMFQEALKHRPTLAERRFIEAQLNEQNKLDAKRFYRPDFHALNMRPQDSSEE